MLENEISEFDVAIIGMACRFPKAENIKKYWENLLKGVNSTHFASADELQNNKSFGIDNFVNASIHLEDKEQFDPNFFKMSPSDALIMDPQIRGLLQTSWHALEDAGYDSFNYRGAIGNFCTMGTGDYLYLLMESDPALASRNPMLTRHLNEKDFLATQISYRLNLTGPSMSVQAACSSSLLAVHLACQSLLSNECDMALAGGAQIDASNSLGYTYTEGSILSPDGYCRAFDKDAKGTVPGNGMGMILLKKLSNAIEDGDHIYSVIKGSAANNDGANKMAYTAPSVESQRNVILEALSVGEIEPETVELLEAHGTATSLGDPVEVAALKEAYSQFNHRKQYCALGSVKTNIGHLDCAAGIASLIKAVLCVQHGEIPPSLNFKQANPSLELESSPFYVNQTRKAWKSESHSRRAGISSIGVGGTNVHVVIEEFKTDKDKPADHSSYLIPLSAKTPKSLSGLKKQLMYQLKQEPELELANIEHTLLYGRHDFGHKFSAICKSKEELIKQLGDIETKQVIEGKSDQTKNNAIFMFPGQGSQFADMAKELYGQSQIFKTHLNQCCTIADKYLPYPLVSYIFGEHQDKLIRTDISQIAIFVIEYCLLKLWGDWGLQPSAVVGHSLGEFASAVAAEVMSLEDAIMLVYYRGQFMAQLPAGCMISVELSAKNVKPILCDGVVIAAINTSEYTVLSGSTDCINNQKKILLSNGITFKELKTSHAFHSPMMEGMLSAFKDKLDSIELKEPKVSFISTVTGSIIESNLICTSQYWLKQITEPVQFEKAIHSISSEFNSSLFIEIGPGTVLSALTKSILQNPRIAFPSLPKKDSGRSDLEELTTLRALLWYKNIVFKKPNVPNIPHVNKVSLLGTVFDTQRYWIESPQQKVNKLKKTISDDALAVGLELSLLELDEISESQFDALKNIQEKLIEEVELVFESKKVNLTPFSLNNSKALSRDNEIHTEENKDLENAFVNRITDIKYIPPSNKVEVSLVNIWQSIFGYQPVGINDNFFSIGGDSLTATTMLKKISNEFEVSISFKDIAENQTIAELAKTVDLRTWLKGSVSDITVQEGTERFEI